MGETEVLMAVAATVAETVVVAAKDVIHLKMHTNTATRPSR